MSLRVSLSPRDLSLLRLLSWTPATTTLLLRVSAAFEGGAFLDERRLRERLQSLAEAGLVRLWTSAQAGGGLQNYYKVTPLGFDVCTGSESEKPPRAFFAEVAPSLFAHTFRLAEAIVEIFRSCHSQRITILRFIRENELTLLAGDQHVQPDCFFRLETAGQRFNVAFEVDNSTASIDSPAANSIGQKLLVYDHYQETVLADWRQAGKRWERPRFRVVFLTPTVERAYHILGQAAALTVNKRRRLILAAPFDVFVGNADPLQGPIFLDHDGHWHALIDLHPTAKPLKAPARLPSAVVRSFPVC